jgi:hypothetical protein
MLADSFGILYPLSEKDNCVYFSGVADKYYPRRDLQLLKKLTIKIYNDCGQLLTMENLNMSGSKNSDRHILNVNNQVFITLRIICVDHQFN